MAPGANPRRIQFDVRGAKRIRQDENGELVFKVGEEEIRWHKPVVYQEKEWSAAGDCCALCHDEHEPSEVRADEI